MGRGGFDFVKDLGALMPMRTIGMLLGIPESDQQALRDKIDEGFKMEDGVMPDRSQDGDTYGLGFGQELDEYIDWREQHPSDDLMTALLQAEFEDETGTVRHLNREELLTYVGLVNAAGNETTTNLISWTGKVLGEHPEQLAELAADPSLVPNAIEELLRYEAPSPIQSRYCLADTEWHGQVVPEGSILSLLTASANRDDRVSRPRPFRHPPQDRPSRHVRVRHSLLPRGQPGPARGSGGPRGGPAALEVLGGRLGPRGAESHHDRAGLVQPPGFRQFGDPPFAVPSR